MVDRHPDERARDAPDVGADAEAEPPGPGLLDRLRATNRHPDVVAAIRRLRRALPGDPYFGDPLSTAGYGGPETAARAANRFLRERSAASRELSHAGLQMWQALAQRITRTPGDDEVTLAFTDLVGFSSWALTAGDERTLRLLRTVAQVVEPPLLAVGGRVVKRMGDGLMAVFADPLTAVGALRDAREELRGVEVDGYTPQMRIGVHTGRPQRLGSDWLGIDVNIAARVMESAGKGGLVATDATLAHIDADDLAGIGLVARRIRRPLFGARPAGMPADIALYRLTSRRGADGP